jgi:hypothetical protein
MYFIDNRNRFWFTFLLILLSVISPFINPATILADGPLAFASTQPTDALENEDYSWQIILTGGTAPYSCNLVGSLPAGLFFDAASLIIYGKLPKGTSLARYTFGLKATDSSDPPLSVESTFIINVQYRSNVSISSAFSGETNVYVDGQHVNKLRGGGQATMLFTAGTQHTISVDPSVTAASENNVRITPVTEKIVVDGLSPDAFFDYSSEYEVHIKSNQPDIPALSGSGWYKTNGLLESAAPNQIEPRAGTQYRFTYWLLPTGEAMVDDKLKWNVTKSGDATAMYDTYYQLTVNSEYCDVEGADWYKAGSKARWSVKCSQSVPAPGFWGYVGVELKARPDTGSIIMDAPKEVSVTWKADYSRILIPVVTGIVVAAVLAVIGVFHERSKKVVAKIKEKRASSKE